jgi:rhamnosyltransferase
MNSENPIVSVMIRTYNEEKWIEAVLKSLMKQTFQDFEIVIVDSQSTDKTVSICKRYNCRIVEINKSDFNYSYASNVGVENSKGKIINFLSGHSVPMNDKYLENAMRHFKDENTAGVYGEVLALPDGGLIEKVFHYIGYKKALKEGIIEEKEIHPGIMSCSNAFARKDFCVINPFKVELGRGGEDVELAYQMLKQGKKVVKDPEVVALHSHGSSIPKFVNEFKNWREMYADVLNYIENEERK